MLFVVNDTEETKALKKAAAKLLRESSANQYPAVVYHYTSLEVAEKILNSFQVWCTNTTYATDETEGVYGQGVIDETCVRDPDLLMDGARSLVKEKIEGYTVSFCAKPDIRTQWETYGHNGQGVAIGVDVDVLSRRRHVAFSHIEYDPMRQGKLVKRVLNLFRGRLLAARS